MFKIDAQSGVITFPDGSSLAPPYDDKLRYGQYAAWIASGGQPEIVDGGPEAELAQKKKAAAERLVAEAEEYASALTAEYPLHEVLSFTAKAAEARGILDGASDPALFPVIAAECQITKAEPRAVAQKVMAKELVFSQASGTVSGIRQAALLRIEAAKNNDELDAAIAWARGQAEAAFTALSSGG